MTRTITQESVVAFLNGALRTEQVEAIYNRQAIATCWQTARYDLRRWSYQHDQQALQRMLTLWKKRAERTGPLTELMEIRRDTWKSILHAAESTLAWSDEEWHPYTGISYGRTGYGLHREKGLHGEPAGWLIPEGGAR